MNKLSNDAIKLMLSSQRLWGKTDCVRDVLDGRHTPCGHKYTGGHFFPQNIVVSKMIKVKP